MTYTGDVTPGGPSDVRELPDAIIRKASVSAQDNNSYLITCRLSGQQVLIDAADNAPRLIALLDESAADAVGAEGPPRLATVVTTHRHWDHHRALPEVVAAT